MIARRPAAALLAAALAAAPGDGPPGPRVAAQAPSPAPVQARMFATGFTWRAAPGTRVTAELVGPAGVEGADEEIATVLGEVFVEFVPTGERPALIEPGDAIVLRAGEGAEVRATVPPLLAALDADRRTVRGQAPAGAEVALRLGAMTRAPVVGRYVAGDDGRLVIPLDEPLAGDGRGELILTTGEDHAFTAGFAAFSAEIPVGRSTAGGWASAGASLAITLTNAAGSPRGASGPIAVRSGRSWSHELPTGFAFRAGDVVALAHRAPTDAAAAVVVAAVPALAVRLDPSRQRVHGEGPPGAAVEVEILALAGDVLHLPAVVDASGAFSVEPAEAVPPGARVRALLESGGGLRFAAEAPTENELTIRMFGQRIEGVVDAAGAAISITLRAGDGTLKGAGTATSSTTPIRDATAGAFIFTFGGAARILPGDVLTLDWRAGDPMIVAVPRFTAVADVLADAIVGEAPPGSTLEVSVRDTEGPGMIHPRTVRVEDDGRYRVDYAGVVEIAAVPLPVGQPSIAGMTALVTPNRIRYELGWAALQLEWQAGRGLQGHGPPGRDVDVVLAAPDGTELGTSHQVLDLQRPGTPVRWTARLEDAAGQPLEARAGDRLRVVVGDLSVDLEIPELTAVLFAAEDRLSGRTLPRTQVGIGGSLLPTRSVPDVVSDAQGYFSLDLAGVVDVRYNDVLGVSVRIGDLHRVQRLVYGPGVDVALDEATVAGTHQAEVGIAVEQMRGGAAIARSEGRTDPAGRYALELPGGRDPNRAPRAGDALRVGAPEAEGDRSFGLDVPELSIAVDRAARALYGRAEPGGKLVLQAFTMFWRDALNAGSAWSHGWTDGTTIGADGSYRVDLPPIPEPNMIGGPDLRPGQRLQASYTLPSGNIVRRHTTMPIANVELGGARVCGFAAPWQAVEATLLAADGAERAAGAARADGAGAFDLVLRDPLGRAVATTPGQTVRALLGGDDVSVPLDRVEVTMRWDVPQAGSGRRASEISGLGPPRRDYYIHFAGRACLDAADRTAFGQVQPGTTNAQGAIRRMDLSAVPFPPGQPIEVAFYTAQGHRFFVRADRTLVRVHLREDRVTGTSVPLAPLELALAGPDGAERAAARVAAGVDGAVDARLRGAGGPARIAPGDRLVVRGAQGEEVVDVEDVDFDFSASTGLLGKAPAGRPLRVALRLADGRVLGVGRVADDDGVFRLEPADLPPRRDWELGDIVRVDVTLPTLGGHEIVVGAAVGADAGVGTPTVYLPFGMR